MNNSSLIFSANSKFWDFRTINHSDTLSMWFFHGEHTFACYPGLSTSWMVVWDQHTRICNRCWICLCSGGSYKNFSFSLEEGNWEKNKNCWSYVCVSLSLCFLSINQCFCWERKREGETRVCREWLFVFIKRDVNLNLLLWKIFWRGIFFLLCNRYVISL